MRAYISSANGNTTVFYPMFRGRVTFHGLPRQEIPLFSFQGVRYMVVGSKRERTAKSRLQTYPMPVIGELRREEHTVYGRDYMHCPQCNNQVSISTTVCVHCGAEIGVCIKCKNFSFFVDIDFSQLLERISAAILLGMFLNYSKVKFRKCAMCKNSVQVCTNCGKTFKGLSKCPYCSYSHLVGFYSIIEYLKSKV